MNVNNNIQKIINSANPRTPNNINAYSLKNVQLFI